MLILEEDTGAAIVHMQITHGTTGCVAVCDPVMKFTAPRCTGAPRRPRTALGVVNRGMLAVVVEEIQQQRADAMVVDPVCDVRWRFSLVPLLRALQVA